MYWGQTYWLGNIACDHQWHSGISRWILSLSLGSVGGEKITGWDFMRRGGLKISSGRKPSWNTDGNFNAAQESQMSPSGVINDCIGTRRRSTYMQHFFGLGIFWPLQKAKKSQDQSIRGFSISPRRKNLSRQSDRGFFISLRKKTPKPTKMSGPRSSSVHRPSKNQKTPDFHSQFNEGNNFHQALPELNKNCTGIICNTYFSHKIGFQQNQTGPAY